MTDETEKHPINKIWLWLAVALLLALGLWLRRQFITAVQLYPDEFVTLLAIQMIVEKGVPVMPSGLFYEHGLLYSYLGSIAAALGEARWTARYLSLLLGGLTLLLTFWVGRRWFSPAAGLIAMTGLAIAPAAIHWSGRVRMYALLQLLVLLTIWLAFEGIVRRKTWIRWLALLAYFLATMAHFAAVALAPPLVLAVAIIAWLQKRRDSKPIFSITNIITEGAALIIILIIAFLVKRAGQPKGIDTLEAGATSAATGIAQVFQIYSDFSFNIIAGWQAVNPFYLSMPALIFSLFALLTLVVSLVTLGKAIAKNHVDTSLSNSKFLPSLYLSLILLTTTLEMILIVSPDRRDDKYLFMLLPVLLLLGARGIELVLGTSLKQFRPASPLAGGIVGGRNPQSPITAISTVIICALIILLSWPHIQALLSDSGDDYDTAFAYVQEKWEDGDTILTGTPAAAAIYLGHNDFYSVQRRGGYDYRILTVENQPVDRWLASPAIRTEEQLHQTLANNNVWLVLERWGLQREYYDPAFQQQLLAQTYYVTEAQGIFVLRSKPNPQPILSNPANPIEANFDGKIKLTGYTIEPEQPAPGQPLRLTLYWQPLAALPHDYTIFVHLRHPDGGNVAQADHRPLGSLYPTSQWPVSETIRERSDLYLPDDLPLGNYDLWVGMYLLETGERLPVQNDTSGENAVKLGEVTVGQ